MMQRKRTYLSAGFAVSIAMSACGNTAAQTTVSQNETRYNVEESAEKLFEIIEKELKAFEIIKEKKVDVFQLIISMKLNDLNEYNKRHAEYLHLTQEEYELLKEELL